MTDSRPEPIKPTAVPLSRPADPSPPGGSNGPGSPGGGSTQPPARPPWLWLSLAAVAVFALLVIFALPRWVALPEAVQTTDTEVTPAGEPAPPVEAPRASDQESSQDEARQNAARRDSQGLLTELLELRQKLEGVAVTRWAPEEYRQAESLAETGDSHYRQRDFVTALGYYQQATALLEQLQEHIEPHRDRALADGLEALTAGDADLARAHFELALAIDPDHEQAQRGLERADILDEVIALLSAASELEASDQLEEALARFEQALSLDPQTEAAREGRDRVREQFSRQRYQAAVDDGFAALRAGDDRAAQRHFQQALGIRPGDSAARSGLNQATTRLTQHQVAADLQQARQLEQQERWQEAGQIYARLYDDDSSLVEARVGRIRSAARAELDRNIEQILADPLRLGRESVLTQGQQLLRDARAVNNPGPRLQRQTTALDQALQQATTPVPVAVRSDNRTRVTLLRVAELGTLEQTRLTLRPGRYVATGSRDGYRDVRIEFDIPLGSQGVTVEVICDEPVRGQG